MHTSYVAEHPFYIRMQAKMLHHLIKPVASLLLYVKPCGARFFVTCCWFLNSLFIPDYPVNFFHYRKNAIVSESSLKGIVTSVRPFIWNAGTRWTQKAVWCALWKLFSNTNSINIWWSHALNFWMRHSFPFDVLFEDKKIKITHFQHNYSTMQYSRQTCVKSI